MCPADRPGDDIQPRPPPSISLQSASRRHRQTFQFLESSEVDASIVSPVRIHHTGMAFVQSNTNLHFVWGLRLRSIGENECPRLSDSGPYTFSSRLLPSRMSDLMREISDLP